MKSSKYTQANSPNDNDFRDYQNIVTMLPERNSNQNQVANSTIRRPITNEELLKHGYDYHPENFCEMQRCNPERNANLPPPQEFEMQCKCVRDAVLPQKHRIKYSSEQNIVLANQNFSSLTKLDNGSQFSLDRKGQKGKKHSYTCEQNQRILHRIAPPAGGKRMQSPEVISIHRGYDAYGQENATITPYGYDKGDDYGFRRQQSFKRQGERANGGQTKRRPAGDGMDSEMDDPELMFEVTDQMRDCPCACDHVIYGPGYTNCLQEERFPPAPDVTRRLGAVTPLGKPDTPPYYRAASATNSSSTQSSRVDLSTKHWWIIVTVLLLAAAAGVGVPIVLKISAGASLEERLEFASRLLQEVPLIDGHNDLPWNIRKFVHNRLKDFKFGEDLRKHAPWSSSNWSHTDLPRLKQGHVAAQFWAAYVPCDSQFKDAVQLTLEQIDLIIRLTEMYQPSLTLCTSSEDITTAYRKNQMCSLIGVEGGHSLAGSLAVLRSLYQIGVRYLTLTSTCNTPWADCSFMDNPGKKPEHGGLTNFGKTLVKEMNRLGMIVDLSHVSAKTMKDALAVSKAPVIFSHSSAYALCNVTRNVNDATLRTLALNKGVIMVNFYSRFLTCSETSTLADAVAHINHIRDVAGVDSVGLGAGYDGINSVPEGLEDVSSYPTLFAELVATGNWSVDDLKKLAGLNFLRVMQEVERVRDQFKKAKVPPYEDVLVPKARENNCTSSTSVGVFIGN